MLLAPLVAISKITHFNHDNSPFLITETRPSGTGEKNGKCCCAISVRIKQPHTIRQMKCLCARDESRMA